MNPDNFESRLQRTPLRRVPAEWRGEILNAARCKNAAEAFREDSRELTFAAVIRRLLWPCPRAWAALAAVWVGIFAIQFSLREKPDMVAQRAAPPSLQVVLALQQQRQLLAELMGQSPAPEAEAPKRVFPRPRSERHEERIMA